MKKVLLIQTAFIGDAILSTAAVEALAQRNVELHVIVRKGNEIFFQNNPSVSKVWIWDKKNKWKSWWYLLQQVRSEKFDELYLIQRFFSMSLFSLFSGAKSKWVYDKSVLAVFFKNIVPYQMELGIHEVDRLMHLVQSNQRFLPKLFPQENDYHAVLPLVQQPFITMSPSSVWETKRAPEKVWKSVALRYPNHKIYLLGGPGDVGFLQVIQSQWNNPKVEVLAGQLSLIQSAVLMSKAEMNFVNDSGPLHLCSAMNAPVRAFFCSTVQDFGFGPLSQDALVLETTEELPCRPCGLHGKKSCPRGDFACGEINISQI